MSWQDRLKGEITLTTPSGIVYTAQWVGDDISGGKRVGITTYPGYDGATTQDQGLDPFDWPLTLYFDGEDNDLNSFAFVQTYAEKGTWTVIHPLYGRRTLQPVKFTLTADPTGSGNVTVVKTTWIEARSASSQATLNPAGQIDAQIGVTNGNSALAASNNIGTDSIDLIKAAQNAFAQTMGNIKAFCNLTGDALTIYGQLQAQITGATMDVLSITGTIQQLLQTPGLIVGDIGARAQTYSRMLAQILAWNISGVDTVDRNIVAVSEIFGVSAMSAMCQDVSLFDFTTRSEAVQTMTDVRTLFQQLTDGLDTAQTLFANNSIQTQYFSQSQSYNDTATLISLVWQYLLSIVVNLKAAKVFTTDRPRAPIEIAITEYGQDGWDDSLLDFLLLTNNISNTDILLLPAGREVVIYAP